MENRLVITSLCAAAIVYACGPWVHSQASSAEAPSPASRHASLSASQSASFDIATATPQRAAAETAARAPRAVRKLSGVVATALDITRTGSRVDFALRVVNNSPHTVELRFPSARTHDFTVIDSAGHTVWRASDGRLYTQTLQAMAVRSRDTLTLGDSWDASKAHGAYVAVALLATDTHPVEQRVPFRLP